MKKRGTLMMMAALLLPLVAACTGQSAGTTGGGTPPGPPFSADTAYAYVRQQVSYGPRVPGTEAHDKQLAWMLEFLQARADTVVQQHFTHQATNGNTIQLTNVFARFRPDAKDRVLLLAHWDTRPNADQERDPAKRTQPILGANDGASGTAVLLELANVLKSHSPPIGVDLLFVDGEDYSAADLLVGSNFFAANLPAGYKPLYGILLDMIGDENPVYPIEGNSQDDAPEVIERVWRTAEDLGLGNIFVRRGGEYITDDHAPLNQAGIRTIDIIDFDFGPGNAYWHTLEDNLSHTSPRGLDACGRVLTALIFKGG